MFSNTAQEERGVSLPVPVLLGARLSPELAILKAIHVLTGLEIGAGHAVSGHCRSKEKDSS